MFVAIVQFPQVPAELDGDLREWFAWSSDKLRGASGLQARRLLRGDDGTYVALVEHDSAASFKQMHASSAAIEVQLRLHDLLEEGPRAELYEVVDDSTVGGYCGGHHDAVAAEALEPGPVGKGGCCSASQPIEAIQGATR